MDVCVCIYRCIYTYAGLYLHTYSQRYLLTMPKITAGEESDASADDGGSARVQWVSRRHV